MTTSRETIKNLITKMKQEFEQVASSNLEENRRVFDAAGLKPTLPDGIEIQSTNINQHITADWLIPKSNSTAEKNIIVLFFHGGGFSVGSAMSHRPICARIAKHSGCKVLSVNYRLAPENKYPAALEDAVESYLWLKNNFPEHKIFIAGDSAGGGLAMATLLSLKQQALPMPAGAIGISAWLDLECSSASYQTNKDIDLLATEIGLRFVGRGYANKKINNNPLVSPFYSKDLLGLCPLLIQIGSAETLLDENVVFAERAKKDGVNVELQVWPNMVHVWHSLYGAIPEAEQAIVSIGQWVNKITA